MGKAKKKVKSNSTKQVKTAKRPPIVKRPDDKRLGNNFWTLRSKHGADKIFSSPEILLQEAEAYFQSVIDNPFYEAVPYAYKGVVRLKQVPKIRPFTLKGLCIYLGVYEKYFTNFKSQVKPQNDNGFTDVILYIEGVIFNQQYENASAGFLKENIVSRMLGLRDNQDVTTNGSSLPNSTPTINVYNTAPPLSGSEQDVNTKRE